MVFSVLELVPYQGWVKQWGSIGNRTCPSQVTAILISRALWLMLCIRHHVNKIAYLLLLLKPVYSVSLLISLTLHFMLRHFQLVALGLLR